LSVSGKHTAGDHIDIDQADTAVDLLVSTEVVHVPVDALLSADSPRLDGENDMHIRVLAESERRLPPILVHRHSMRVIDGMHRLRVAQLRGRETIEVQFVEGDELDVFSLAVAANRAHGLPLTLADREAAVERIIRTQPDRSDRMIASITGLAAGTVGDIRRRLGGQFAHAVSRMGRDGRVRPVNAADGRRAAREVIASQPNASLREIARLAGISPATARDVRERLRRGDDPIAPGQRGERDQAAFSGPGHAEPVGPSATAEVKATSSADVQERDWATVLHNLSRDPSLRFTESGREVLRWLFMSAKGVEDWQERLDAIPSHCAYVVVGVARGWANEWLTFAEQLQKRLTSSE
jgi:hypothetical protein